MENERDLTQKQTIQLPTVVKEIGGPDSRVLEFIASTETPDRSNDVVDVAGWVLDNYIGGTKGSNPVFAWSHDYSVPAIGKTISAVKDLRAKALVIRVKFPTIAELCSDPSHPSEHALFVDTVYNLYKSGTMSAVSVGFRGLKYKTRDDAGVQDKPEWMRGVHFLSQELLEVSAVVVPANQEALIQARGIKSFNGEGLKLVEKMLAEKGAIPFHAYPLADEATPWNGPGEIAKAEVDDLKKMCAWCDSENADVKGSYKLPHHEKEGYKTVWNGVRAAMGAIMGARGGVNIPEGDKKSVHAHLAKHYVEFGKEAPDFGKSYTAEEMKSFFGEENEVTVEELKSIEDRIKALEGHTVKAGAKFSATTKADLAKIVEGIGACHVAMKACHKALNDMIAEPDEDKEGTEATTPGDNSGVEKPKPNVPEKSAVVDTVKDLNLATASLEDALKMFKEA